MNFKNLFKSAIKIVGNPNCEFIIAYKEYIFCLNYNCDIKQIEQIEEYLGLEKHAGDILELRDYLLEYFPEVLVAHKYDDTLYINTTIENAQYKSSPLLNKVMRALGIQEIKYDHVDEAEPESVKYYELNKNIPDTMYHGTSSENVLDILRTGLRPGLKSNYNDRHVYHNNHIFLTTKFIKAQMHADQAVRSNDGFPVILEFKIPDKNLLVPDFDIDTIAQNPYRIYPSQHYSEDKTDGILKQDPFKFSRDVGVFGYAGRIPASFIINIYTLYEDEWTTVTKQQIQYAVREGIDYLFYVCPDCGEEKDENNDCSCTKQPFNKQASISTITAGPFGELLNIEIADLHRYSSDKYLISLSITETKEGYSVGFQVNSSQLGVSGYVEYWVYDFNEKKKAYKTYKEVSKIIQEVANDIQYNKPPLANITPMFRTALLNVDLAKKEKSGVFSYNHYLQQSYENDYRSLIYGNRYNIEKETYLGDNWINQEEKSKKINTEGNNREKVYKYAFKKEAEIPGEWWIDDSGYATFADGDIGDYNHEAIALQAMVPENVLEQFDYDIVAIRSCDDEELLSEIDPIALSYIRAGKDAREYALKELNWIRVHGNNFEVKQLDLDTAKRILNFIGEETHNYNFNDDDEENNIENEEIYIEQLDRKTFSLTVKDLEDSFQSGNIINYLTLKQQREEQEKRTHNHVVDQLKSEIYSYLGSANLKDLYYKMYYETQFPYADSNQQIQILRQIAELVKTEKDITKIIKAIKAQLNVFGLK